VALHEVFMNSVVATGAVWRWIARVGVICKVIEIKIIKKRIKFEDDEIFMVVVYIVLI